MLNGEKSKKNNDLVGEIVVTEAMIEAAVKLVDVWLSRWIKEMSVEGHLGFEKEALVKDILCLCKDRYHQKLY